MFISTYDTLVCDRRLIRNGTLRARMLYWLEKKAVRAAQLVILDTVAHARRVESLFDLRPETCFAVPVGVDADRFQPCPVEERHTPLRVLFYGQFIPLHGIDTIIQAARLMRDEAVEWTLVGKGQEAPRIRHMLREFQLPKVKWIEWVSFEELREWISRADLCLGIFGDSEKAASVIPNKVYQIVSTGRPLITRDSAAVRELLSHSPPCVYLIPANDPGSLADAVRQYERAGGVRVGQGCHAELASQIQPSSVGRRFIDVLNQELKGRLTVAGR
jgi:glycosyltransferase involved in cell wall biosynthesis